MLKRRHINGDPRRRGTRILLAAADAIRWPFERAAWSVERRLIWPLQKRLAGRGAPRRGAGIAALATIVAAAALAAVLVLPGGEEPAREQTAAQPSQVAIVAADPQPQAEKPQSPSLQGAPPHFGVGNGVGVSKSNGGASGAGQAEAPSPSVDAPASAAAPTAEGDAGATASSAAKPVPAGPAAMKVARRFAEAFVFYEIGEKAARAEAVFGETATEQLAKALEERPPRLPSNAKVPKAKVLNLVPGPRFGTQYTVSVSLLRVGITSELRLTLQKEKDGGWSVAQVLG
ncbi:MAG TPA: hypothetical protein VFN89_04655 [Solirubrobacterales bacterium]|nr:hypothetical protein [Solirubrobacterales bacterium]